MTKICKGCWTSSTIKIQSKFWAVRDVKLYRPRTFSPLINKKKKQTKTSPETYRPYNYHMGGLSPD